MRPSQNLLRRPLFYRPIRCNISFLGVPTMAPPLWALLASWSGCSFLLRHRGHRRKGFSGVSTAILHAYAGASPIRRETLLLLLHFFWAADSKKPTLRSITRQTRKLTRQKRNLTHQMRSITRQTRRLTRQTRKLTHQTTNLTHQMRSITHQTTNLTHQMRSITRQTRKLTHQTTNLTRQIRKLTRRNRNIDYFTAPSL